jgi:hypothetical protein
MNKNANALGLAIAATLGATTANAASYEVLLNQVVQWRGSDGAKIGNISSSTATWSYDDVTGLLSQTSGTFNVRFTIAPTTTLYRHLVTGLVLGNGGAASASSFLCSEGNFGGNVGAHLCGNYNFGANYINESSASWGPGTAFGRTLAGDDQATGPQQSIAVYDAFSYVGEAGTGFKISNASCDPSRPGGANSCATVGGYNTGYTWFLNNALLPVPVPAAVWLFGSALVVLGGARRRNTRK